LSVVDAVIAWVDGADPEHRRDIETWRNAPQKSRLADKWRRRSTYTGQFEARERAALSPQPGLDDQASRFSDHGELRYLLRSIEANAPFIDRIFLLTNGQRPQWINQDHPKLRFVTHREIFPDPSALPTFNSSAIETNLHRIPQLSDDFIYLNDDFFFGRPVTKQDFMTGDGRYRLYVEAHAPMPQTMTERSLIGHCWAFNNVLLAERLGDGLDRRLFAHTPLMYNRRLLQEIELVWHDEIDGTRAHRFRTPFDAHMRSLYTYYVGNPNQGLRAMEERTGVGEICSLPPEDYIMVRFGDDRSPYMEDLGRILRLKPKFFCINDELVPSSPDEQAIAAGVIGDFLEACFPKASSFESRKPSARESKVELQPVSLSGLRVEALATPAEDRVSVWRKAAGEPFFSLHFASDATPGDGPAGREGLDLIRPDDEIRIDAPETMTTIELIASARHPDDGQDPRRGFGVDRRSRVSLPTGNGEPQQAGAVIRDAALRESFIASLAARMAPTIRWRRSWLPIACSRRASGASPW
jgi:hypothetical protein